VVDQELLDLLAAGVLGHSLCAFTDGVLGELTGQQKPDSSLDLPGGQGGTPVVVGQTRGLGSDALKDVVHKGVHDGHRLAADASVGVHLLQDLVDVDGIAFPPPLPALLVSTALGLRLGGGLLGSFACCCFGWHAESNGGRAFDLPYIPRTVPFPSVKRAAN